MYIHIYTYIGIYIHVYIYIYIHIYTCIHVCTRKQKLEDSRTSFKKALDSLIVLASLQVHCSVLSVLLCVGVCRTIYRFPAGALQCVECVAVCGCVSYYYRFPAGALQCVECVAVCGCVSYYYRCPAGALQCVECVAVCRHTIATLQLCSTSSIHSSSTMGRHECTKKVSIHIYTHVNIFLYTRMYTYIQFVHMCHAVPWQT